jgi:hypothetical protein
VLGCWDTSAIGPVILCYFDVMSVEPRLACKDHDVVPMRIRGRSASSCPQAQQVPAPWVRSASAS